MSSLRDKGIIGISTRTGGFFLASLPVLVEGMQKKRTRENGLFNPFARLERGRNEKRTSQIPVINFPNIIKRA